LEAGHGSVQYERQQLIVAIEVSIIEDDDWIRENLAAQIGQTNGFRCIGSYRDGEEALIDLIKETPDVVMMDINLPKMNGIECVRKFKKWFPPRKSCAHQAYRSKRSELK